jgi:hypothetical protein
VFARSSLSPRRSRRLLSSVSVDVMSDRLRALVNTVRGEHHARAQPYPPLVEPALPHERVAVGFVLGGQFVIN